MEESKHTTIVARGAPHVLMLYSACLKPFQGRYRRVMNTARALAESGYRVTILAWDREARFERVERVGGVEIRRFRIPAPAGAGPALAPRLLAFWFVVCTQGLRDRADVIHCHNIDVLLPGFLLARAERAKLVLDACEPEYYTYWRPGFRMLTRTIRTLEQWLSRQCSLVLVHNEYQVGKYGHWGSIRVELVGSYPSLSLTEEAAAARREIARADGIVFGRIGTIYEDNGIEEIVAGFERLKETHPQVRLLLAGRVLERYEATFRRLIAPLGDAVDIIGAFPESAMPHLYARTDVSLMLYRPSAWFSPITPTKFFDSLACGVPVLTSPIGGLPDIIARAPCGVVVTDLSPESVADAMGQLADDADARRRMACRGLELVRTEYNWEAMKARLLAAYGDILRAPDRSVSERV